jgi:hypothetical protein
MKALKSFRPESVGRMPVRPASTEQKPLRSEATMQTDAHIHKAGGRLSREDQRRLGDILQRVYDDVVRQGVPDRFKDLLTELDEHHPDEGDKPTTKAEAEEGRDQLVKVFPHNKGSS